MTARDLQNAGAEIEHMATRLDANGKPLMEDHVVFARDIARKGDKVVVPVEAIVAHHASTPFRHTDLVAADAGKGYTPLWDRLKTAGSLA